MLTFITGNKTKFKEVRIELAPVKIKQAGIDLPEIQEIDLKKILKAKLQQAFKHHNGPFIIEDSGLYFDCFKGKLPGPFIKWFNDTLGATGLYKTAKDCGNTRAVAKTTIAYAKNLKEILYFDGTIRGRIVKPRGKYLWGYDEIFMPDGSNKTLSELKSEGDFSSSPRGLAVKKLKRYLCKIK